MTTVGYPLVALVSLAQHREFHSVAALTWLVYDYLLSLEDEAFLIWGSADTIPKLLYFISRYFGLVVQCLNCANAPHLYCQKAIIWTCISLYILVLCVEMSLMLRLYALYGRSRLILIILSSMFVAETTCVVTLSGLAYKQAFPNIIPYPSDWPIQGCYYPPTPAWFDGVWLPLVGFETLLFVLMAVKVYSYRPLNELPILLRVLRDGTIYYFVILIALILCTLSPYTANAFLGVLATVWISAILSFSGAHLLLSLRTLAAERIRADVATPDISEGVPEISMPDGDVSLSPIELVPTSPRPTPVLPRHAIGRRTRDSTADQRTCNHSTWLSTWEYT
ncbi:hypothetical protein C8Q72DRAFT_826907 [Fomitopsis betulina]|nr:hypothetical protein C8Q72DRAFT_826907 [Fomitopsis betulina]